MTIDKLFELKINKDELSWNISSVDINITEDFKKEWYTYNEIIENLMFRWIISIVDKEEVPLFWGDVYLLEEYNELGLKYYIYFNEYQVHDENKYLYKNNTIKLNCLNV